MVSHVKRRNFVRSVGAGLAVGTAGCIGNISGGGGVEMTVAECMPEDHEIRRFQWNFFQERVEELTDGEIEFDIHPGGALGDCPENLSLIRDGTADIATLITAFYTDQLPLHTIPGLPGSFQDPVHGAEAFWPVSQPGNFFYENEIADFGIRPAAVATTSPFNIFTTDDVGQITEFEDWEDVTARSAGGATSRLLEALGATPVEIPAADMYSALQSGTINAAVTAAAAMVSYGLEDFVDYGTTNISLGTIPFGYYMNDDSWEALSEEHQEAFQQAGEEAATNTGEEYNGANESVRQELEEEGTLEAYEIPSDVTDEMDPIMADVETQWVDSLEHPDAEEGYEVWEDSLADVR